MPTKYRQLGSSKPRVRMLREVEQSLRRLQTAHIDICYLHLDFPGMHLEEPLRALDGTHHGIGVAPDSPIARGVLAGKYLPGAPPEAGTRAGRGDKRITETAFRAESLAIAQQLQVHATAKGVTLAQFATAWVLANRAVSSVIAGPRTLAQWQDYLPALDDTVDAADEALVNALVAPGHPSRPGFNDPAYPLVGRRSASAA